MAVIVASRRREWQLWGYGEAAVAVPLTPIFRTERRVREEVVRLASQSTARLVHVRFRDVEESPWYQHKQQAS